MPGRPSHAGDGGEIVEATGATRAVPIHWDDVTRTLRRPLVPLPPAYDDLPTTMRFLQQRARETGIVLHLPRPSRSPTRSSVPETRGC